MNEADDFTSDMLERLAPTVHVGSAFAALEHRRRVSRRRRRVGRASVLVALLGLAGTTALRLDDPNGSTTAASNSEYTSSDGRAGGTAIVSHEVIAYEQTFDGPCPDGMVTVSGEFDTMTFESWGSEELGRWHQTVTYPDSTTRDYWAIDDPLSPTQTHFDGTVQGHMYSCGDIEMIVALAEPGDNSWFALNPTTFGPENPDGDPAVVSYRSEGQLVPGEHIGPDGQTVELWRQQVEGFIEDDPVQQVTEWLVDPATGLILEKRWTQTLQDLYEAAWIARLVEYGKVTIDRADLETSALPHLETVPSGEVMALTETVVPAEAELGNEWVWPATPIRGETVDQLVRRFAQILGWDDPTIDAGESTGPSRITLHGPDQRRIDLLATPTPDGPVITQVGFGPLNARLAAGSRHELEYLVPAKTAIVEMFVSDGATTRAWTSNDAVSRPLLPADLTSLQSALVIARDAGGTAITAFGSSF